jgi:hypothetical protein
MLKSSALGVKPQPACKKRTKLEPAGEIRNYKSIEEFSTKPGARAKDRILDGRHLDLFNKARRLRDRIAINPHALNMEFDRFFDELASLF